MKTPLEYIKDIYEVSLKSFGDDISTSNFMYELWKDRVDAYPIDSPFKEKYDLETNFEQLSDIYDPEELRYIEAFKNLIRLSDLITCLGYAIKDLFIYNKNFLIRNKPRVKEFKNFHKNNNCINIFLEVKYPQQDEIIITINPQISKNELIDIRYFLQRNFDYINVEKRNLIERLFWKLINKII